MNKASSDIAVCFLYFGDNEFNKFSCIHLKFAKLNIDSPHKIFDSIFFNSNNLTIEDVFPSWSYTLFLIDDRIFYSGFKFSECSSDVEEIRPFPDCKVLNISCGWKNIMIATSKSITLFSVETGAHQKISQDPIFCSTVKKVCIGNDHHLILVEDGEIFAVYMLPDTVSLVHIPVQNYIVDVACGKEHTLLLTRNGQVYSYGFGSRGQLGQGDTNSKEDPMLIEALDGIQIKSVACGGWHSAAISVYGDLYMWGWNESGQLGFPCSSSHQRDASIKDFEVVCCTPKLLNFSSDVNVCMVSCGSRHSAAMTDDSYLWTWGWNAYGQLGHRKSSYSDVPEKVELPNSVKPVKVSCSFWSTVVTVSMSNM